MYSSRKRVHACVRVCIGGGKVENPVGVGGGGKKRKPEFGLFSGETVMPSARSRRKKCDPRRRLRCLGYRERCGDALTWIM